jgi:hypothetical protein
MAGMNAQTIIDALGGVKETAKLARCTVQAVYQWRTTGEIPVKAMALLKASKPKVFRKLETPVFGKDTEVGFLVQVADPGQPVGTKITGESQ